MKTARQTTFDILLKIQRDNAYSNLALDGQLRDRNYDSRDTAFISALVYGVLERKITLEYQLEQSLRQPLKKLRPEVRVILNMGVYQLLYMDKVPESAAVNESVILAKKNGCAFAAGLVNAVLRSVLKKGIALPEYGKNHIEYLSVKYSCPQWLVKLWTKSYGEENAVGIMENAVGRPPITVRVNTLKVSSDELIEKLAQENVGAEKCSLMADSLKIENTGAVENLKAYKSGLFHVQDISSQLCCKALSPKSGEHILDVCAAPGGKTFTAAEMMNNVGQIDSFDIYESRTKLIADGAERLGIGIVRTNVQDASAYNENIGQADKVLCDVPCSGLGIIRRKPEIRYKTKADIDNLPNLQYFIVSNAARYVKKGGRLIYSTCTLNPSENEEVVRRFLNENKDFQPSEVFPEDGRNEISSYMTIMPHINNTDGFFIAAFVKKE